MTDSPNIPSPTSDADLLARYGDHLESAALSEAQKRAYLSALWSIMTAFVDLGFDVGPGKNLHKNTTISFDDVLYSLHLEETAHETVASPKPPNIEEQQS